MTPDEKVKVREAIAAEATKHRSERAAESLAITEQLRSHEIYQKASAVLGYFGIGWEPDTRPLLESVLADGKALWLPRMDQAMTFRHVTSLDHLQQGPLGFRQPPESAAADVPDNALILVPGVAFDRSGGRVGRGYGHYDRWLENRNFITASLAFSWQVIPRVPIEPHDIGIKYVVTPAGVINCRSAS